MPRKALVLVHLLVLACEIVLSYLILNSAQVPYDMRDVVAEVVDDGVLFEVAPAWARNVVTGLARMGGEPSSLPHPLSPTNP